MKRTSEGVAVHLPNIMTHPYLAVGGGVLLAALIAAVYFGVAFAAGLPPFSSEQDSASNVQIVLDRSVAMATPFGDGTKLEVATRAIDEQLLTSEVVSSGNLAFREYGGSSRGPDHRAKYSGHSLSHPQRPASPRSSSLAC